MGGILECWSLAASNWFPEASGNVSALHDCLFVALSHRHTFSRFHFHLLPAVSGHKIYLRTRRKNELPHWLQKFLSLRTKSVFKFINLINFTFYFNSNKEYFKYFEALTSRFEIDIIFSQCSRWNCRFAGNSCGQQGYQHVSLALFLCRTSKYEIRENALVEFHDYKIPITQIVGVRKRYCNIFFLYS